MTTPASRAGRSAAEATGRHAGGRAAAGIPDPSGLPAAGGIPPGPATDGSEGPSVVRSSGVMALGTLASRGTGFLRTLVLAYALGVGEVANAYNNANTLPNTVYDLMLGGILTSVVVPLLVNAAKRDADRGEAYDQRMFTLGDGGAARPHGGRDARPPACWSTCTRHRSPGREHHLMVIFAYFFIPQIFFYGMSSLAGAILNARGQLRRADVDAGRQQRRGDRRAAAVHRRPAGIGTDRDPSPPARCSCSASAPRSASSRRPRPCSRRCAGSASGGGHDSTSGAAEVDRDRPDGRLDVRLHRHHPGRVPGRPERANAASAHGAGTTASPPTPTPGSCSSCRTPSSASRSSPRCCRG